MKSTLFLCGYLIGIILVGMWLLFVLGCSPQAQQFTAGDLGNAAALAAAGHDPIGAMCWAGLGAAAAPTPQPKDDGLAVAAERARLVGATVSGACGGVVAPILLHGVTGLLPGGL